jgi:hypothetical protein
MIKTEGQNETTTHLQVISKFVPSVACKWAFLDITMKQCTKCHKKKPLDKYSRNPKSPDGLVYWCKDCFNVYLRNRYHRRLAQRQQYRKANRHKLYANLLLHRAVKRGKLIRPDKCEGCQETCKPSGHHPDYGYPLEVEWLCTPCHLKLHRLSLLTAQSR